MVWDVMSFHGLSDFHIVPRGRTVTSDFYMEELLNRTAASKMKRQTENVPLTVVKPLPDMVQAIFQQGGAPSHTEAPSRASGAAKPTSWPFGAHGV